MNYENDFETGEIVELDVEGYPKGAFKYKPQNAGEENEWLKEYMSIDPSGRMVSDLKKLNQLKLNNVFEVPYNNELIKKMVGIDKGWQELSMNEKWRVFGKLKSKTFDKILTAINNLDKIEDIKKKE